MLVLEEILVASIKHKHTKPCHDSVGSAFLTMDGFEMLASIALKVPKECFKKAQQQKKTIKIPNKRKQWLCFKVPTNEPADLSLS